MKTHQLKKKYADNLEAESWGSPPVGALHHQLRIYASYTHFSNKKKLKQKKHNLIQFFHTGQYNMRVFSENYLHKWYTSSNTYLYLQNTFSSTFCCSFQQMSFFLLLRKKESQIDFYFWG